MDEFSLPLSVYDYAKVWKNLEAELINSGPLSIMPNLNFIRDETQPSLFTTITVEEDSKNAVCHVYIIPYDGKFDLNLIHNIIPKVNQFSTISAQFAIIINLVKSQWSISTSKSKIKAQFKSLIDRVPSVIAKYSTDAPNISEQTTQEIHQKLEKLITLHMKYRIDSATDLYEQTQTDLSKNISPHQVFKLASRVCTYGYYHQSIFYLNSLLSQSLSLPSQFWPNKPRFIHAPRFLDKPCFDTGFDILVSTLNAIFKAYYRLNSICSSIKYFVKVSQIVIENSLTRDQLIFARIWIFSICQDLIPLLEKNIDYQEEIEAISLHQISSLFIFIDQHYPNNTELSSIILQFWKENQLLQNAEGSPIIQKFSTDEGITEIFLDDWNRARRLLEPYPNHIKELNSIFYDYLIRANHFEQANTIAKHQSCSLDKECFRFSPSDSRFITSLFNVESNVDKKIFLASQILSSNSPTNSKNLAMDFLVKSTDHDVITFSPSFSISSRFHAPSFLNEHSLADKPNFSLTFSLPSWLCNYKLPETITNVTTWVSLINFDNSLTIDSIKSEIKLENHIKISSYFPLLYDGRFSKGLICIQIGNAILSWPLKLVYPLKIARPSITPSFELVTPRLLANNTRHGAQITISNIDTSSKELHLSFVYEGLQVIRLISGDSPQVFNSPEFVLTKFASVLKFEFEFMIDQDYEKMFKKYKRQKKKISSELSDVNIKIRGKNSIENSSEAIKSAMDHKKLKRRFSWDVGKDISSDIDNQELTVIYTILKDNGKEFTFAHSFEISPQNVLGVRLFKQNSIMQQFQLANSSDSSFDFEFNKKMHHIKPRSNYYLLRPTSEDPLLLNLFENGWDEYPVLLTTSLFNLKDPIVNITFSNPSEVWTVGTPREVTIDPPATALTEETDFVVSRLDPFGFKQILIPLRPGKLEIPKFLVKQQVANPTPRHVYVNQPSFPPFIPV